MSDMAARKTKMVVKSPAKVNWTLGVLGKRPDGFHEIASLVSVVTLYDELEFSDLETPGVAIECDTAGVPTDERNLIWRAAKMLCEKSQVRSGVRCCLRKRIPAGGGLGGGSSNSAAALLALNDFWGLHLSREELAGMAAELGSDVPLFLDGGSAVITGRGEHVRATRLQWRGWLVLLMPGLSVATASVYRAWRPGHEKAKAVEPRATRTAIEWMQQTFNMLETPAIEVCPQLGVLQGRASELAGRPVRVSGSGSTMFTAFDEHDEAVAFSLSATEELGIRTEVVQPVEQA